MASGISTCCSAVPDAQNCQTVSCCPQGEYSKGGQLLSCPKPTRRRALSASRRDSSSIRYMMWRMVAAAVAVPVWAPWWQVVLATNGQP